MSKTLTYLFDPLCGWCYGAGGALTQVLAQTPLTLKLMPTGLFAGDGARDMTEAFAAYAWANDQRITGLTGEVFSERYRNQVLTDSAQPFDSGPATVALTAVHLTAPAQEFDALKAIQQVRYVDGQNITRLDTLSQVLTGLGLSAAAERLQSPDDDLLQATQNRVTQARTLLRRMGALGVPLFVLEDEGGTRQTLIEASTLYASPQAFAQALRDAG